MQVRVKGNWELGMGNITFRVNSVEEIGPGISNLRLHTEDIPKVSRGELDRDQMGMMLKLGNRTWRFDR